MIAKLEVELDPPAPACPGSTFSSPRPTAPAPGGGRRHRKSAAGKAKATARAALHRATQATAKPSSPTTPALGEGGLHPQHCPLNILPSPSPSTGRRQVTQVWSARPSFAHLNLDGSTLPRHSPPTSTTSITAAAPAHSSSTNTTGAPWAPATAIAPHQADPQVAARWRACGLCRAGACLPAICDYQPTS